MPEAWMIYRGGAPHDGMGEIGAPPPSRKATAQTAPARLEKERHRGTSLQRKDLTLFWDDPDRIHTALLTDVRQQGV